MDAKEMEMEIFSLKMEIKELNARIETAIKHNDHVADAMNNGIKYMNYLAENMESIMSKINGIIDISENPDWEVVKNKIENDVTKLKKFTTKDE